MDNMNNVQEPKSKENNKMLIIVSSAILVVVVAIFVGLGFTFGWFGGSNKQSAEKKTSPAPTIKVVKTKGAEGKTTKVKISVRDVKFGDKIKEIKRFEKTQKDTLDNPTEASTKDGYTYLTYLFNTKNAEFYGVKPTDSTRGSLLQYVFYKKKLFDIRLQYGDISSKDRDKIQKNVNKKYGKPTYGVVYSNKSTRDMWRTYAKNPSKQTILSLNYSPNSGMIVDYESVTR